MRGIKKSEPSVCGICGKSFDRRRLVPVDLVRPRIAEGLDALHPRWRDTGYICADDLQAARRATVEEMIRHERGELTDLDRSVVDSLAGNAMLSENAEESYDEKAAFGDRLADRMAGFAGSWTFIIIFGAILFLWMAINAIPQDLRPFDPFPFILLNLILSCIAAVQAPLIMMSQRRVEAKDRMRSQNDYQVNLKAELEIRHLHEKIDHHLIKQWERLAEIQELQLEIMEELASRRR